MIPTRLLALTIQASTPTDAFQQAKQYTETILDESDATFARVCGRPTGHDGDRDIGAVPVQYRPVRHPGVVRLFEQPDGGVVSHAGVETYFDSVTPSNEQVVAFQRAVESGREQGVTPTPLGAAVCTVALSKTFMRHRSGGETADYPASIALDEPAEWYCGTGEQDVHPDLTPELAAALSTPAERSALRDQLAGFSPHQHLYVAGEPTYTIGDFVTQLRVADQRGQDNDSWFVVGVDVGVHGATTGLRGDAL